ncbi:MAG: GTP cyclohydrolase II [Deltaproteobacteria bacterium]|nr:MAG: GTP cyclohydrolase II [Deltaproteobacteria bacterium]
MTTHRPHMDRDLEILAQTPLPTEHGRFRCLAFRHRSEPQTTHLALVLGEVQGASELTVRVHSECFTGEVLGSLKCDCRGQLNAALARIAERGRGVLVYLRQEGRGIGLVAKLKAYALQEEEGLDTVDANRRLGLPDDLRRYEAAAALLDHLGVDSVVLLTNNPAKVTGLTQAGTAVARREPLVTPRSPQARRYLETKAARMGHILEPVSTGETAGGAVEGEAVDDDAA